MSLRSQSLILGIALTGLLGPLPAPGASPRAWEDAKTLAAKEGKPLLIDFRTDW